MSTFNQTRKSGHSFILAALAFTAFAMISAPASAAPRGMTQMLGGIAQSEQFNDALSDFAGEHDLDADQLKGMMANQKATGAMTGRKNARPAMNIESIQKSVGQVMGND